MFGQLKFTVRRIYSSPPAHGAYIAADVMNSSELYALWQNEVYMMRDRIRAMRQKLYGVLTARIPDRDFTYFIKQRGMFGYTGVERGASPQVARRICRLPAGFRQDVRRRAEYIKYHLCRRCACRSVEIRI